MVRRWDSAEECLVPALDLERTDFRGKKREKKKTTNETQENSPVIRARRRGRRPALLTVTMEMKARAMVGGPRVVQPR